MSPLDATVHLYKLKQLILVLGRDYKLIHNKDTCLMRVEYHFKTSKKCIEKNLICQKIKKVSFLQCREGAVGFSKKCEFFTLRKPTFLTFLPRIYFTYILIQNPPPYYHFEEVYVKIPINIKK